MSTPDRNTQPIDSLYRSVALRRRHYHDYLLEHYLVDGDRTISPDDAMLHDGPNAYFMASLSALHQIDVALRASARAFGDVQRILDIPCGHGRVLRALRAAMPAAEIVACDIDRSGVDFCARQFDATPVYSCADVDLIPLEGVFDLVWVGSLFTHLDAPQWRAFLRRLFGVVRPGGVLVFTTAGRFVVELIRAGELGGVSSDEAARLLAGWERTGFGFARYEDDDAAQSVDQTYGRAVVRPEWVIEELSTLPGARLVTCSEQAWNLRQDVYAVTRSAPD